MARKPNEKKKILAIEERYQELFQYRGFIPEVGEDSLEQPSPLKIVPSLTTYGAYEEPIIGT